MRKKTTNYSGPGSIKQNNKGGLELKLYSEINDLNREISQRFQDRSPGKLINDDQYFSLEAIDMSGNQWHVDHVWVSADLSIPASGIIVRSNLNRILLEEEIDATDKSYLFCAIPGKFDIPCNEKVTLLQRCMGLFKMFFHR